MTILVTLSLVGGTGTAVVAGLWWLFAGEEPAAAEYVEFKDRRIHAVRYSPDGTKLLVDTDDAGRPRWTGDLGARPWKDVDTPVGDVPEKDRVTAVAVSADGTRFASGAEGTRREREVWIFTWDYVYTNGVVRVREQDTGGILWQTPVRELALHAKDFLGDAHALAFSPDGSLLAGDYDYNATLVWDAATGTVRAKLTGGGSRFSPDGGLLAVVDYDGVHLWDTAKQQVSRTLAAPSDSVGGDRTHFDLLEFSPDGRLLATGLSDGTVRLWNVATGAVTASVNPRSSSVDQVVFSPDGRLLTTIGYDTVQVWDTATGGEWSDLPGLTGSVDVLVFSPDGRRLATGSSDGRVRLWDTASWQQTRVLEHRERFLLWTTEMSITSIAFSPDGKTLATASNEKDDGKVALWELS